MVVLTQHSLSADDVDDERCNYEIFTIVRKLSLVNRFVLMRVSKKIFISLSQANTRSVGRIPESSANP